MKAAPNRDQPDIWPPRFLLKTAVARAEWDLRDAIPHLRKRRRDDSRDSSLPEVYPIKLNRPVYEVEILYC